MNHPSTHARGGYIGANSAFRHNGKTPEKTLEHHLVTATKTAGGIAIKLFCPGFDGMPDRLILLPGGRCGFVEVKQAGLKPRPLQLSRHRLLRRLGFQVFVLDNETQIEVIIREISTP